MRPLLIGLTGSLAAGKSTVARLFQEWGAVLVDADELAREAVAPATQAFRAIRARFGDEVIGADGTLDRPALRSLVFGDPAARADLEAIVHAEVRRLRERRHEAAERSGAATIVDDVPLLFETRLEDAYDAVVVVDAPVDVRRERTRSARGWSAAEFESIERSQIPAAEKRRRADHVISNDGDPATLAAAARDVWDRLTGGRAPGSSIDPRDPPA